MVDQGQIQDQGADRPSAAVPEIAWAGPTFEELAALRRHPRFAEALTASMRVPLDLYEGNRLVNLISNDRGRYILTVFALHLHYTRRADEPTSGLTATRLQTMCAEQGVCSFGRAGALIQLLRFSGYLAPAPRGSGQTRAPAGADRHADRDAS